MTSETLAIPTTLPFPAPIILHANANRLPRINLANNLLLNQDLIVPSEIISGLLHAGTKGVLAGPSKMGKTCVLLDLATSIASGIPFLRWKTTTGKVLFINFEIHEAFFKQRLEHIKERKQLANLDNLSIWTLRGQTVDFDELMEKILGRIEEDWFSLIILDPIYKLMVGRSETTASSVGMLCHDVERLVESTGASVIYAHHFTKGNGSKKEAMDRMSGSGVFARDADTILTFTEHEEEKCYAVEMTLRNLPPQEPFVVEFDYPVMLERKDLNPFDLAKDQGEQESDDLKPLLALLDEKPLTVGEWEKAAKDESYSRATFFRIKKRLESDKLFQFNRMDKMYSRSPEGIDDVKIDPVRDRQPCESPESGKILGGSLHKNIPGTGETIETTETALFTGAKFQAGQPVSSLKSPEISNAQ
jgi:hypothetical protein